MKFWLPLVIHLGLGAAVVSAVWMHCDERNAEVARIRAERVQLHLVTERLRADVDLARALRDGIRTRDAYTVELLARERLGMVRVGEILAPAQRVDSSPVRR